MPDDQEPKTTIKGLADLRGIGSDLTPVVVRVPQGHPVLTETGPDTYSLTVEEQLEVRPPDPYAQRFSREISKAVADLAMQQAEEARQAANTELMRRLDARRQMLTEAVADRLADGMPGTPQMVASLAVDAMLAALYAELRY